ncbi:hypothetical protein WH47_02896 [Habropoda laboriosa]|uniref:Uncharacterized protein n=1 Tax=Habropoda laboriosa TaxID=597456 RepID=A0A0L7RHX6_9HYME|nr:hypothetical protein WH47_02896 [Habropoda laboriosa]
MCYQNIVCCPVHYARQSQKILNRMFPNCWIRRGSNIAWTARSPDLTPLDHFLWETLKNEVYRESPTTAEHMRGRTYYSDVSPIDH